MVYSFSPAGLVKLPPVARRLLLIAIDAFLLPLAVWLSFWLRMAHPFHPSFLAAGSWLLLAVLLVGLPLYASTGQYKGLTRYVGSQALYRLAARNGLLVLLLAGIGVMLQPVQPASVLLGAFAPDGQRLPQSVTPSTAADEHLQLHCGAQHKRHCLTPPSSAVDFLSHKKPRQVVARLINDCV